MPFYQCFVYNGTAIVTEESQTSQGGAVGVNSFETGDITAPVKPSNQPIYLYEYTGSQTDASVDGSIIASLNDVAIESYLNRVDSRKLSVTDVSASSITITTDSENFWYNYTGSGTTVFTLPSLVDVPEDFEVSITNRSVDKNRIVVNAAAGQKIDLVYDSKIITYGSWARIKAYSSGWIIAYEVNQGHSSGDINNPGSAPAPDEIVFDRNIIVDVNENKGSFKYVGAAASIITLPDTDTIPTAWELTLTNNSSLGSVLSVHTDSASQTVDGSQIYYLAHGQTKKITYTGTGSAFAVVDVNTFSFDNQLTQATSGQIMKFVTQADGALGWGPADVTFIENVVEDTAPELGGNLDLKSNFLVNNDSSGNYTVQVGTDSFDTRVQCNHNADYLRMYYDSTTQGNIRSSQSLKLRSSNNGDISFIPNGTGEIKIDGNAVFEGTLTNGSGKSITSNDGSNVITNITPIGTDLGASYTSTLARRNVISSYEINSSTFTPSGFGSASDPDHLASISQGKDSIVLTTLEQANATASKTSISLTSHTQSGIDKGIQFTASNGSTIRFSNSAVGSNSLIMDFTAVTNGNKTLKYNNYSGVNVSLGEHTDGTVINTTANRPASPSIGMMFFDTTLAAAGKPIWYTGVNWVDADGNVV